MLVDFMDKVVRSNYRSGHYNLFIDSDPLPFILFLDFHLICVVKAAWKQPAGSESGGPDVSSPTWVCWFCVFFVLFCVFLQPFVHMQTEKTNKKT